MNEEEIKAINQLENTEFHIHGYRCIECAKEENENCNGCHEEMKTTLLKLIEKQQKQIDLMAEYISDQDIDEDICKKMIKEKQCNHFTYEPDCTECVKQYFKNKAEKN